MQLKAVWIESSFQGPLFWDSGVLVVMGEPADSTVRLGDRDRLRVNVSTSRGDAEELEYWRELCNGYHTCTYLSILMKQGHEAREVESVLEGVPARYQVVAYSGSFGSARVFDPDRVAIAIQRLQKHGSVQSVDPDVVGGTSAPKLWLLLASAPVDATTPKPNDGIVQALSGDTIRVKYDQPNGTTLQFAVVVP